MTFSKSTNLADATVGDLGDFGTGAMIAVGVGIAILVGLSVWQWRTASPKEREEMLRMQRQQMLVHEGGRAAERVVRAFRR